MSRLFGRNIKVVIYRRPTETVAAGSRYFDKVGNGIEITDLRVQFEVTKNLGKEPNKAVVRVSNLAENTRTELERGPLGLFLYAGYDGEERLIFTGDISRTFSKREERAIVTTMQVADGLRAFAGARLDRSYKPPVKVDQLLRDMCKSMGLAVPIEVTKARELKQAISTGFSASGPTRDLLSKVLAPYGYSWSIQNGQLQVLRSETAREGTAFVIDESTPIIGSPERTYPEKAGEKKSSEVKFDTLLYPELVPGALVQLRSELLKLDVKLTDVKHTGDNYGPDMITSCQGKPL